MKHHSDNVGKTLERILREIGDINSDEMEQSIGSVAQSLRAQTEFDRDVIHNDAHAWKNTAPRPRRRFVLAAVLVATAAIGVYAAQRTGWISAVLPEQRTITPQLAPVSRSPAVSVTSSRASEGTSPRALAGGSREPAMTRGGWTPLRTAAEEIAFLQSTDSGARRLEFAAASVRRREGSTHVGTVNCRGIDGELFATPAHLQKQVPPVPQGRCIADGVPLTSIIAIGFQSSRIGPWMGPEQNVVGIPEMMLKPPYFQIQAVADNPSSATRAELQQMFQALLMDRFKLKIRREIRQMDGYVLTVAKSGVKFKETSRPEAVVLGGPAGMAGDVTMETFARFLEVHSLPSITGQSITIPNVGTFPRQVPVDNNTGLKGVYAIKADIKSTVVPGIGGGGGRSGGDVRIDYDPPLPKALEEQLGLVLTRGKVPVEYIVVEHIEAPSEN